MTNAATSGEDTGDLLSMLLLAQDEETGGAMTDEQIRDECLTLFLAGHETTANALTWTFYLLSQNPEAKRKFHAELDEVLGNKSLTPEDYPRSEIHRTNSRRINAPFPPAWTVGRLATEAHEFGGFQIPPKIACFGKSICHAPRRAFLGKRRTNSFPKDGKNFRSKKPEINLFISRSAKVCETVSAKVSRGWKAFCCWQF